jgi:hypothetical protein
VQDVAALAVAAVLVIPAGPVTRCETRSGKGVPVARSASNASST